MGRKGYSRWGSMTDYEFWTLFVMLMVAILTNAVSYWTARTARENDRKKIDAMAQAVSDMRTTIENLGKKYLRMERESRDADIVLKVADLTLRAGEKAK
jgi:hypothetical protein